MLSLVTLFLFGCHNTNGPDEAKPISLGSFPIVSLQCSGVIIVEEHADTYEYEPSINDPDGSYSHREWKDSSYELQGNWGHDSLNTVIKFNNLIHRLSCTVLASPLGARWEIQLEDVPFSYSSDSSINIVLTGTDVAKYIKQLYGRYHLREFHWYGHQGSYWRTQDVSYSFTCTESTRIEITLSKRIR